MKDEKYLILNFIVNITEFMVNKEQLSLQLFIYISQ